MTLRPEGTAPVVRSFVENRLYETPAPHKFFYIGPMFRYERPQSGRYRQHHQFGAEAFGVGKPEQDVELIDMACEIYRKLGLTDLVVQINSVGDEKSRAAYREALSSFLTPLLEQLSEESQARFSKNMLRILDSKDPQDKLIMAQAPSLADFLTPSAQTHFAEVLSLLDRVKIPYVVQPSLVRGLDYYNGMVFEVAAHTGGAQNALGGGGRYDGLVKAFGGPDTPSAGFGTGLERILQTLLRNKVSFPPKKPSLFCVIPLGKACEAVAFAIVCELRHAGFATEIALSGRKIQQGLQLANEIGARYAILIGDEEIAKGIASVKDLSTRHSTEVPLDSLFTSLTHLAEIMHV